MTTPGARVRQERLRQRLSLSDVAARAKVSIKTVQRVEADERDQYLFLVEEALGLTPSSMPGDSAAVDEGEMLRRVSHRRFWLEAAQRAQEIADMPDPGARPGRGEPGIAPSTRPNGNEVGKKDEPGDLSGAGT